MRGGEPDKFGNWAPVMSARFYKLRLDRKMDNKPEGKKVSRVNFHSFRRWFAGCSGTQSRALPAGPVPAILRNALYAPDLYRQEALQEPGRLP